MSQKSLGNSYERQSALKASITLESAMIGAGLLKPESLEDAFQVCETYYTRFLLKLTEGMDSASATQSGFSNTKTPDKKESAPETPKNDTSVIVRLTDGDMKTKPNKDRLKELGFWWNNPAGSYDWSKKMEQGEWDSLKETSPFNEFNVEIE